MLLHDLADPLMELAKIALYLKQKALPEIFLVAFALVFVYSRVYVFPRYIIADVW